MARIETIGMTQTPVPAEPPRQLWRLALDVYLKATSIAYLGWALWEWAALIGVVPSLIGDPHRTPLPRQGAAFFFAGIDPVAAVGLWLGSTWGVATWLLATFARVLIHTAYAGIFDWTPVGTTLQVAGVAVYLLLFLLAERAERDAKRRRRRPRDLV